jgi:anti-sigma-K factor RskA
VNIQEYIASGILESYALGEVTETERASVEQALKQYPEISEELKKVEETLENIAFATAIQPRAHVKEKIISRVIASTASKSETKVIAMTPELPFWKYATAASVAVALFASYMAFQYRELWKTDSTELAQIKSENQRMAEDYNVVNQKLDKIQGDLAIIENTAFTKVVMKGTANDTNALASVYWNSSTQEVFLSIQQLKTISKDNQFQLWAIVNGKPVDAGVFDLNFAGLQKMKSINGAVAFAVTIEPRGGKENPTMETMQVIGNVTANPS